MDIAEESARRELQETRQAFQMAKRRYLHAIVEINARYGAHGGSVEYLSTQTRNIIEEAKRELGVG